MKPDRSKFTIMMLPASLVDIDAKPVEQIVYADEVQVTANGDLAFITYVPESLVLPGEEQRYTPKYALMVPAGRWTHFEDVSNGSPLWKQSGKVAVLSN